MSGDSTPEGSTFALTHSAPDTVIHTSQDGPAQTLILHRATGADTLGFSELKQCRTGRADREEQLRVLASTGCMVMPAHRVSLPTAPVPRKLIRH